MRSSSPEQGSPIAHTKQLIKASFSARSRQKTRDDSMSSAASRSSASISKPSRQFETSPERYYTRPLRQTLPPPAAIKSAPPPQMKSLVPHPKHSTALTTSTILKKSGNDLLASAISTTGTSNPNQPQFKPLYRRFENLTNRIILALQEEISLMESDLANLDRAVADAEGRSRSRRAPPPLLWQRGELCAILAAKVEQYRKYSLVIR